MLRLCPFGEDFLSILSQRDSLIVEPDFIASRCVGVERGAENAGILSHLNYFLELVRYLVDVRSDHLDE